MPNWLRAILGLPKLEHLEIPIHQNYVGVNIQYAPYPGEYSNFIPFALLADDKFVGKVVMVHLPNLTLELNQDQACELAAALMAAIGAKDD